MRSIILEERRFHLSGSVLKYGVDLSGNVSALVMNPTGFTNECQLVNYSISSGLRWEMDEIRFDYRSELRICDSCEIYVSTENIIYKISEEGSIVGAIKFDLEQNQRIGSFVLLEDGIIVFIEDEKGTSASIWRIDNQQEILWKTKLYLDRIAYGGIVQMSAKNAWRAEVMPGWEPENWIVSDSIVITKNHILVFYFEMPRSGIGITYCLGLETGEIKWETAPAPHGSISYLGKELFLIGHTGYGTFETKLWDSQGNTVDAWDSYGPIIISPKGEIFSLQMRGLDQDDQHLVKLLGGGQLGIGPHLDGYFTVYPVVDEFGNTIFWRDHRLYLITSKGESSIIFEEEKAHDEQYVYAPRTLLYNQGVVIFSMRNQLYVLETQMGRLANSSWPCKFGNNERNPVMKM